MLEWISTILFFCGCWLRFRGSPLLLGPGLYRNGFLKALDLRVLVPLSRLVFIIGAWLVLEWISKNAQIAGVGSAVEVGLYYGGFACIRMDF